MFFKDRLDDPSLMGETPHLVINSKVSVLDADAVDVCVGHFKVIEFSFKSTKLL